MDNASLQVSDDIKIMAGIGHVCLQWSRLEMGLLGVLYTVEDMPMAKGEIIFGGLDILPRVNMAINLARYAKIPNHFVNRIVAIRKSLQNGLSDRRNLVVHGAHKNLENGGTTLTMVRWRGDKRSRIITTKDLYGLGDEIFQLGNECWSIMDALGEWKFGQRSREDV